MKILSLFSGCGGLDLGFEKEGYEIVFANDFNKSVKDTYNANHKIPITIGDIKKIDLSSYKDIDGIIGGPPCQAWSLGGNKKGLNDDRGTLYQFYIDTVGKLQPKFFLCENVSGILSSAHNNIFDNFVNQFKSHGYTVQWYKVNTSDFGLGQDRERVIVVGFRNDLQISPFDIKNYYLDKKTFGETLDSGTSVYNNEYDTQGFSPRFKSRNRRRNKNELAFCVTASGRQTQLHPDSSPMVKINSDLWEFTGSYRRLSVRECARLQGFPEDFEFKYIHLDDGYKMIGNAVAVNMAQAFAKAIKDSISL